MAEYNQSFRNFEEWVNKASSWLTRHPDYDPRGGAFRALCFDEKGRLCRIGADFHRARDEGAFPVRWLWPDQIALHAGSLFRDGRPPEPCLFGWPDDRRYPGEEGRPA